MYTLIIAIATFLSVACKPVEQTDLWPVIPESEKEPLLVQSKATPSDSYSTYETYTVKNLPGFNPSAPPKLDKYGGIESITFDATGFFRVEEIDGRWWIITPLGHPFIAASVGEMVVGGSDRQKRAMTSIFGTLPLWAASEMDWIRSKGFTALGRGSSSTVKDIPSRMPYCVYCDPMYAFSRNLQKNKGYDVPMALPILFDDEYESYISQYIRWLSLYANDPYCIGIFTDNELYWTNDILKIYITRLPAGCKSRKVAQEWLDERKGKINSGVSDITPEDVDAFKAYCLDSYLSITKNVLRMYDPNHMFIGQRFYSWTSELVSPAMLDVAGRYMDIVSINHYTKWTPSQQDFENWSNWSGRPIIVSEFYVKGEDSGLPNNTGIGWIVPTQRDRGLFYENFVISLLKTKKCVGWQWFKYQDNDPEDLTADPSNIDSNKGLVKWNFERYDEMIDLMEEVNLQIYNLIEFYDTQNQ